MDLDDIKRKAAAARAFDVPVAPGVTVVLREPTKLESSIAYTRVSLVDGVMDSAAMLRWQRGMLLQAITGWSGVVLQHVLSELVTDPAGPVPFVCEPGAAEVLLDAQPGWEEALSRALLDRLAKRKAIEDTAAKN